MCFSAEASFTGAACLAMIGTATMKLPLSKKNKMWMTIPLFFAIQQFCEGVVWLGLRGSIPHSALTVLAKDLYLFFSLAFWLIWFPLSFLMAESSKDRQNILKVVLAFGVVVTCINLTSYSIFDLSPSIKGYSIRYLTEAPLYKRVFYLTVIALPPLISSLKNMKIFGLLAILSCVIAEYFYATAFTSVWCFLGSFVSAALYLIARSNVEMEKVKIPVEENLIHK